VYNKKCYQSESLPFYFIDKGSGMSSTNVFAILIFTLEMAYTRLGAKRQVHIIFNI
jgi:hypothetical protein